MGAGFVVCGKLCCCFLFQPLARPTPNRTRYVLIFDLRRRRERGVFETGCRALLPAGATISRADEHFPSIARNFLAGETVNPPLSRRQSRIEGTILPEPGIA